MRSLRKKTVILVSLILTLSIFLACNLDGTTDPDATSVTLKMVNVPGGITFPTGTDDSGSATVTNAYWIGETEVTFTFWIEVYTWAIHTDRGANIYYFANAGAMGDGTDDTGQHPVTTINWRDAMVWTNALTEYYNAHNGTSLTCVYKGGGTPIRDSRDTNGDQCDSVTPDASATGFRLLTSDEWELAARYIDDANSNNILDSGEYYPGDYASGADAYYGATSGGSDLDGDGDIEYTSDVAVYGSTSTAAVKSKSPNALGLYDMSGNVSEWIFGLYGLKSSDRGGSWSDSAAGQRVGGEGAYMSWLKFNYIGFRFARND